MVVVPLIIVAGTLGFSMVDPNGKLLISSPFARSSSSSSSSSTRSDRWVFGYGIVLGMGLSSALSYEARRRRLWERVRVKLFSFVQESSALVLGKYRKPTSIQGIEGTEIISPSSESSFPCGIRQEVVSPEWCFTSTMSVTIVTLYSGSQMVPQLSPAVEFYYVIQGEGIYVRGEDDEVMKLSTGLCFVVDPFCFRGFTALGRTDLVLLRASDATTLADEQYVTRRVDNPVSTTIAVLNAGLHKVEALVSKYGATPSQDETINNVADV